MNSPADKLVSRFEANIRALELGKPHVFEALEEEIKKIHTQPLGSENESFHFFEDENKNLNLFYKRIQPPLETALHSNEPQKEVEIILKRANLDYPQLVFFFGQGLGHLLQHFYANRPSTNAGMVLVESNPQIFLRSLFVHDWQELFAEKRFYPIISSDIQKFKFEVGGILTHLTTVSRNIKILANPSCFKIDPEFYQTAAQLIMAGRDHSTVLVGNSIEDSYIGYSNILENIPLALTNPGISQLKSQFQGQTIISVAAGPSTDEHWDTLRRVQRKIPIVACDVLLKRMLAEGVIPDILCSIERHPGVADAFRGVKIPDETIYVGPLLLLKETFEAFEGTKLAYCPAVQNAKGIGLQFLELFSPGSSAGNVNLSLAALMGFKNVIMIGHNLAFGLNSKTSHMKGTGIESQDAPISDEELERRSGGRKVITQDGTQEVHTTMLWESFRTQIEGLIVQTPDIRWINTAATGARIAGAELMECEAALNEISPPELNFYEIRKQLVQNPSLETQKERKDSVLACMKEAEKRVSYWLGESRAMLKKLNLWKEKIKKKESSKARLSLGYLDRAIDEVLKLKVEAVNDDPIFNNAVISIIMPAHTTFEREINLMPSKYKDNYELKRDFLLEHIKYFEIWENWVPRILTKLQESIAEVEKH